MGLLNNKLNLTAAFSVPKKHNTRAYKLTEGTTKNIGETRVDGIELGVNGNITEQMGCICGLYLFRQ